MELKKKIDGEREIAEKIQKKQFKIIHDYFACNHTHSDKNDEIKENY